MTQVYRTQITVFSGTITTDVTATFDSTYTGRRIASMRPPFVLAVNTANAGTAPGSTNFAVKVLLYDSADGTTYNAVASAATTTITAPGSQSARYNCAAQLRPYVKAAVTAAAGTWNIGTTITATLTGEGVA